MNYKAELVEHRNEKRIAVWFDNKPELITRLRKLGNVRWSKILNVWHLPDNPANRTRFKLELKSLKPHIALDKIEQIENFKKYLNTKRYSPNTVKTYCEALQAFLLYFNDKEVAKINNNDVVTFYNDFILAKKLSISYQNQVINSIKLFFKTIRETAIIVEKIYRPKREKLLPNALSKEDVKAILLVELV